MNIDITQFTGLIAALMLVGFIFKNAVPAFPNRFIPLITLILGFVGYLVISKGWSDPSQYVAALIAAATATGAHSGIKNLLALGSDAGATAEAPAPPKVPLILLCALMAAATPVFVTGCNGVPTKEAIVYYTFQDTWTLAHTSYEGWCERVVSGKTTKEQEQQVDAAWNKFRASFKISFAISRSDWTAPTPATLQGMEAELLQLIKLFSK